jgi:hypothetical protein
VTNAGLSIDDDLMMSLRLQLTKLHVRAINLGLTIDLAGASMVAKSNVYELFNFRWDTKDTRRQTGRQAGG